MIVLFNVTETHINCWHFTIIRRGNSSAGTSYPATVNASFADITNSNDLQKNTKCCRQWNEALLGFLNSRSCPPLHPISHHCFLSTQEPAAPGGNPSLSWKHGEIREVRGEPTCRAYYQLLDKHASLIFNCTWEKRETQRTGWTLYWPPLWLY